MSRLKTPVIAVVVLALAGAGWFAYQQYGSPKAKPAAVTQGRGGPGGRAGGMRAVLAEPAVQEKFRVLGSEARGETAHLTVATTDIEHPTCAGEFTGSKRKDLLDVLRVGSLGEAVDPPCGVGLPQVLAHRPQRRVEP